MEFIKPANAVAGSRPGIEDVLNIFYMQFYNNNLDITIGNLYLMYGSGLSLHTYQDQNIDYDNPHYYILSNLIKNYIKFCINPL